MSSLPRSMSRMRLSRLRINSAALRRDPESASTVAERGGPAPWRTVRFVLLIIVALAVGLVGLLGINTSLAGGSFSVTRLDWQLTRLTEEREALQQALQTQGSAGFVQRKAVELGMVPAPAPAFLDLRSGKVKGELIPAGKAAARPENRKQEQVAGQQERSAAQSQEAQTESATAQPGAGSTETEPSTEGDGAAMTTGPGQFQGDEARTGQAANTTDDAVIDNSASRDGSASTNGSTSTDDGATVGGGD